MKQSNLSALTVLLISLAGLLNAQQNTAQDDKFCTGDDLLECSDKPKHNDAYRSFNIRQMEGVRLGHVQDVILHDGKILKQRTLSLKPLVFEIPNFLSSSECEHLKSLANRRGLEDSLTVRNDGMLMKKIKLLDVDSDNKLSINEMMLTIENSFDLYLSEEDILEMYEVLDIDNNGDTYITPEELQQIDAEDLTKYLVVFAKNHPIKQSRYSKQSWLYPDTSTDQVFQEIQNRVIQVTGLPPVMIKKSDFQVVWYGEGGHYNAHQDSDANTNMPCCTQKMHRHCRICRFMTVLFYLNDVPEGGGTAFPVADNDTYDEQELRVKHLINLQRNCDDANLIVKPEQGKAVIWYNHHVDESTGWIGDMDVMSLHGGCPVKRGHKWIANFWIKYADDKEAFLADE